MRRTRTISKGRSRDGAVHFGQPLGNAGLVRHWQQNFARLAPVAVGAMSATQRQAGEILELMGRSTQAKVGLMQQAVRAAQDPNPFGSQAKWIGFWMSAMGLAQSNAAAVLQIHGRAFNSWLRLVGNHTPVGKG